MNKSIVMAALCLAGLAAQSASAQTTALSSNGAVDIQRKALDTALPSTLANTMKAMGNDMKAITAQANNSQSNTSSAQLTDHFLLMAQHSKDFTPDSITSLPSSEQAAAKTDYDSMLDQQIELGKRLKDDFTANNNTDALNILTQMSSLKRKGHDAYKP